MKLDRTGLINWLYKLSKILPSRYPLYCKTDIAAEKAPFFVVSSGRSGTTLLASILDKHPEIIIPPEQFVLKNSIVKYSLYNRIEWLDLVSIIVGEFSRISGTMNWQLETGSLIEKLWHTPAEERSLYRIIDSIFIEYGHQHQQSFEVWGDKSPMTTDYLDFVLPVFPNAKFIGLVRDPRDVAASIFEKNEKADLKYVVRKWKNAFHQQQRVYKLHGPEKVKRITYEDLVRKPEETVNKVCNLLGVEQDYSILEKTDGQSYLEKLGEVGNSKAFLNVASPINTKSIGRYKSVLDKSVVREIEEQLSSELRSLNYLN